MDSPSKLNIDMAVYQSEQLCDLRDELSRLRDIQPDLPMRHDFAFKLDRLCRVLGQLKEIYKRLVGNSYTPAFVEAVGNVIEMAESIDTRVRTGGGLSPEDWTSWSLLNRDGLKLLQAVKEAASGQQLTPTNKIPQEHRTASMTKQEAALKFGLSPKQLSARIKDGKIHCEKLSRQSFVFNLQQFPPPVDRKS